LEKERVSKLYKTYELGLIILDLKKNKFNIKTRFGLFVENEKYQIPVSYEEKKEFIDSQIQDYIKRYLENPSKHGYNNKEEVLIDIFSDFGGSGPNSYNYSSDKEGFELITPDGRKTHIKWHEMVVENDDMTLF
jgi:hypothetical protein